MTDANTPAVDPVEDRVRRTLVARAEDMAQGDSADDPVDLGLDGAIASRGIRGPRRRVLATAAAVVALATATAGVALAVRDGDRDTGRLTTAGQQPSLAEADVAAVTAPRALVDALRNERALAANRLLGIEDAIALPVTDTARARAETDSAIASFEADVSSSVDDTSPRGERPAGDADVETAYRSGIEGLDTLAELRRDIDAHAGPRTLDNVDAAQDVFDRYAAIVEGLLGSQQRYAGEIQDTAVRTGAVAYARGMRLREQTSHLARGTLLAQILPATTDSVTELSQVRTEVQYELDALVAETTGTPFEDTAVAVIADVEEAGLGDLAEAATGRTGDLAEILDASVLLEDEAWPAFLDSVEQTLAEEP